MFNINKINYYIIYKINIKLMKIKKIQLIKFDKFNKFEFKYI